MHSQANVTLVPKPEKDGFRKENYKQISLRNTDVKIVNKILASQTQQLKKIHITS